MPQLGTFVNCIQVAYASNRIWTGSWPLLKRWKAKDKNEGENGAVVSDTQVKVPTVEEIELRACEIYLKRGDGDGVAVEDWLAAERELLASRKTDAVGPLVKRAAASCRSESRIRCYASPPSSPAGNAHECHSSSSAWVSQNHLPHLEQRIVEG